MLDTSESIKLEYSKLQRDSCTSLLDGLRVCLLLNSAVRVRLRRNKDEAACTRQVTTVQS